MIMRKWGGYVSVDWDVDSENIEPLLWCLRFTIVDYYSLDYFLRGILTGDESLPSGGDPGWILYRDRIEEGVIIYHAWTNEDMSYMAPHEADYDEATVKLHIRRTLDNFAKVHPDRQAEVNELIDKYSL